jgi:hypothetical protein
MVSQCTKLDKVLENRIPFNSSKDGLNIFDRDLLIMNFICFLILGPGTPPRPMK